MGCDLALFSSLDMMESHLSRDYTSRLQVRKGPLRYDVTKLIK